MRMSLLDRWSSSLCLIIAALICTEAYRLDLGSYNDPGPGFLPFWNGIALGILSLLMLGHSFAKNSERSDAFKEILWKKVLFVLGYMVAYALVLEKIGFLITTFLFIIAAINTIAPKRWYIVAMVAVMTSLATYLVFQVWLKSQLPKGVLGF